LALRFFRFLGADARAIKFEDDRVTHSWAAPWRSADEPTTAVVHAQNAKSCIMRPSTKVPAPQECSRLALDLD